MPMTNGVTPAQTLWMRPCRSNSLKISLAMEEAFRTSVLLYYTGITRTSTDILADQQRDTLEMDARVLDSLHRTKELGYRIKDALEEGDLEERFGKWGLALAGKSRGEDAGGWFDTAVGEHTDPKSISHEHT